jgi:hypothetical protein
MRANLLARTTAAALGVAATGVVIATPMAHAEPERYQCGWSFTTNLGVPDVKPPLINVRGRAECDVTPLEHHVTLFLTFRPLGSQNWETMGTGPADDQIPAPWANYGGHADCFAGTWHALVSITGKSGEGKEFEYSDVSGNIDVPESECARRT